MKELKYCNLTQIEGDLNFTENNEVYSLLRAIMVGVSEDVSLIVWRLRERLRT